MWDDWNERGKQKERLWEQIKEIEKQHEEFHLYVDKDFDYAYELVKILHRRVMLRRFREGFYFVWPKWIGYGILSGIIAFCGWLWIFGGYLLCIWAVIMGIGFAQTLWELAAKFLLD